MLVGVMDVHGNEPDPPPPSTPPTNWQTIGELGTIGLSFVIALVIGVGLGYWVDGRFGTSPWGFLIGFAFGLAAGVLNVYRIYISAMCRPEAPK